MRHKKILAAARDCSCQWCGRTDGTTVAAHYNGSQGGKGMGCCFLQVLGGWGYERGSEGLRGRLVGRRQLHC